MLADKVLSHLTASSIGGVRRIVFECQQRQVPNTLVVGNSDFRTYTLASR